MAGPLIATKLHIPLLRNRVVERPRLRHLLDRAWDARLTLLSAPAGFGKTTLLAEWLARSSHSNRAIAWLSLDGGESEPSVFWPHVVTAIQTALAGRQVDFPDLPGATSPDASFVAILVNQLVDIETPLILMLDDFHLVEHPSVHAQLGLLVENLPGHVHVVLGTRADPALPLPRLRARGELVEIRAADLRMSAAETAAYLNEVMGLGLSAADTASLEARTEGWAAALQLAVVSLAGHADPAGFIAGFAGTGRYIVDYLVEEVLQRLQPELRQFLFSTCVLRQFNAALCDAVTGRPGTAPAMLDQLERQNLFLVPLDERRQWYRYHHLFADVLLAHLPAEQQGELAGIHRRASDWFEASGERPEAIHHAVASGDFDWAADLLERAIPDMRKHRREASFRAWMKPIPERVLQARPILAIAHVGVLVSLGEFAGVEDQLRDAEQRIGDLADADRHRAHIELYRTALAQVRNDLPAAARHATRVLELTPPDDHLARAGAAGFLGIVAWSNGELERAGALWRECRNGLWQQGHVADVQGTSIALAEILVAQGRLDEAIRVCEEALALGTDDGRPVARGVADTHASLCLLHLERGDLITAEAHMDMSLELADAFGLPQHPYRSRLAEALLLIAQGRLQEAVVPLTEAERRYVSDFFPNVRPLGAVKARLHLRLGQLDEALSWARTAGVTIDDAPSYLSDYEHITLARLLVARGKGGEALSLLDRLRHAAAEGGRTASLIEINILTALALKARGDLPAALAALSQALDLAEAEHPVRIFRDEGEALRDLLELIQRRRTSPFLEALLGRRDALPASARAHPDLIEPLSERELDVLRLLRSDMSGPELAQHLSVSLNTLRTHTKNIFEKLGVNSRRAAVRRATEMNLFGH